MFSCDWLVFKNCDHAFPRYVNDLDDDDDDDVYLVKIIASRRMTECSQIYTRQRTNDTAYPQK